MNIIKLINDTEKPELFAKGTHNMWTDPYISRQLQEVHLNPEMDLASRKPESIKRTIKWIQNTIGRETAKWDILELGCGPGLYTERLALSGHNVTGLDWSEQSIATARKRAKAEGLDIEYMKGDYLADDLGENKYDLIYIVYTDFGILSPDEQKILLEKIHRALKPGGKFLFDALFEKNMGQKLSPRSWELSPAGFWSPEPCLTLSESIPYFEDKAILNQHLVLLEQEQRLYRFWVRFYREEDLENLLVEAGFKAQNFRRDILPEEGLWNGDNVLFCSAEKEG